MPTFKPAYLVHGDDHGRIGERRARLRAMAEAESGSGGFEVFEGESSADAHGFHRRQATKKTGNGVAE